MQQMKYLNDAVPIGLPQASAEVERGTPELPRQEGSAGRKSSNPHPRATRRMPASGKKTPAPTDSTHVDPFGNDARLQKRR